MATTPQGKGAIDLGKRLTRQIWVVAAAAARDTAPPLPPPPASVAARRGAHTSSYDKNPDDPVRPFALPDDLILPQSDKYWAPHPTTGVFGPAENNGRPDRASGTGAALNRGGTALDQTASFRPQDDADERPHA